MGIRVLAIAVIALGFGLPAKLEAQAAKPAMSDQEIIKRALSAAPQDVAANATVIDHGPDGKPRELRKGTNEFVCMAHPEVMCLDQPWQAWADGWMNKQQPKITAVGIAYMLQGDTGASNTDPFATEPSPTNQWVVTAAHIMVPATTEQP